MAIDPTTTTTVRVGELGSAAFNSTDLVPHEVSGVLKKGTLEDLAIFIASIIDVTGAIGFRAVQVSDGETLPATDEQEFILVGPGTYPNVGGGSAVTTTGSLNALVSNGTFWFIGVEIPIEVNGIWGDITGVLSDQTDLNDILDAKADLVGGKVPNSQLPSYVDDVVEVANYAALPGTGETGKIYVTIDTGNIYRWSGSTYIRIADESPVWGIITGTLSDQTDLVDALNLRVPYTGATGNVNLGTYTILSGKSLIGSQANFTRFPNALSVISEVPSGSQHNESLYIGLMSEAISSNTTWSSGIYGAGYTNSVGNGRGTGVTGEGHVSAAADTGVAVGVRGYATDTHTGNYNIGLYGDAENGDSGLTYGGNVALFLANGNIVTSSASAKKWYLGGNLTFDGQGTTKTIGVTNGAKFDFGGTSSQFIKGDGSLDSSTYLTSLSGAVLTTTDQSVAGVKTFTNLAKFTSGTGLFAVEIDVSAVDALVVKDSGTTKLQIGRNGEILAVKYKVDGGSSNQFLKANGSLDSTAYLPLTGGTLTGTLNGTAASFSQSSLQTTLYAYNGKVGGEGLSAGAANGIAGYFANNSNSNPVISLIGLQNTTLIQGRNSSDAITFTVSSIGGAYFADKVGIGTSSPRTPLEVFGNGLILSYSTSNAAARDYLIATNYNAFGDFVINQANANGGNPYSAGTTRFTINASGNVGIGTTNPSEKLTLTNGKLFLTEADPTIGGKIYGYNDTSTDLYGGGLKFQSRYYDGANYVYADRLTIKGNGNVGIGTTSPSSKLHISQSSFNPLRIARDSVSDYSFELGGSGEFYIKNNLNSVYPISILSGGNVGIGTTSPGQKFVVSSGGTYGFEVALDVSDKVVLQGYNRSTSAYVQMDYDALLHKFSAGGTERMRITSAGDFLVGKSATNWTVVGSQIETNGKAFGVTRDVAGENLFLNRISSSTGNFVAFYYNNSGVGSISTNGSSTSYNTSSDYRLKQDLKPINGLDLVSQIKVYDYQWKVDESRSYGVLAHELQEVVPQAVNGKKDSEQMQGVDYSKLVPILVQAIQELKAEIEILKNK